MSAGTSSFWVPCRGGAGAEPIIFKLSTSSQQQIRLQEVVMFGSEPSVTHPSPPHPHLDLLPDVLGFFFPNILYCQPGWSLTPWRIIDVVYLWATDPYVQEYVQTCFRASCLLSPLVSSVLISVSVNRSLPSPHLSSLHSSKRSQPNLPPDAGSVPRSLLSFVHKKNTGSSSPCFSFSFCFSCSGVIGGSVLLAFILFATASD